MTWLERIDKACQEALHDASQTPNSSGSKSVLLKEGMTVQKMRAIQRRVMRFCELTQITYIEVPMWFSFLPHRQYELMIDMTRYYLWGQNRMCITWYLR